MNQTLRQLSILFCCVIPLVAWSQSTCVWKVRVLDATEKQPLSYVSISFKVPSTGKWEAGFTKDDGSFEYTLSMADTILFKCSYLGFKAQEIEGYCGMNLQEVQLEAASFLLKEVVVTDAFPAIVEKKDTVIYRAADFANGNEHKLKELLNKMPGLEVNDKNEIYFKGEKVKEVMVEGETFFTGDASLAVKYVPSKVVDKVQVLEKYNEVKMLAGSGSGDRLALNVTLKPDTKRLFVGELKAGTNGNNRHLGHGNLFYFGQKWRINSILDANTTEQAALTSSEAFRIVGMNLTDYDPIGYFDRDAIGDIATFSLNNNIVQQEAAFGIVQVTRSLPRKGRMEVIGMGLDKSVWAAKSQNTTYLDAISIQERLLETSKSRNGNTFTSINLSSDRSKPYYLSYTFKHATRPQSGQIKQDIDLSETASTSLYTYNNRNASMRHQLTGIFQLNERWQLITETRFGQTQNGQPVQWDINGDALPSIYPVAASNFILEQSTQDQYTSLYGLAKLDYKINPSSHFYVFVRKHQEANDLRNASFVQTPNSNPISLASEGIGFQQDFQMDHSAVGSRWLKKKGQTEWKMGVDYHTIAWRDKAKVALDKRMHRIVPSVQVSSAIYGFGKVGFDYFYNISIPQPYETHTQYFIQGFNKFRVGNFELRPTETHTGAMQYSRSLLKQGRSIFTRVSYMHHLRPVLTAFSFTENALVTTYINSDKAKKDIQLTVGFMALQPKKHTIRNNISLLRAKFYRVDALGVELPFEQYRIQNKLSLSKQWKRIETTVSHQMIYGNVLSDGSSSLGTFQNNLSFTYKQWYKEHWTWEGSADWNQLYTKQFTRNALNLSSEVQYIFQKGKYLLGIRGYNLLNQTFIAENSTSPFSVTNTQNGVIPRFFMLTGTWVF